MSKDRIINIERQPPADSKSSPHTPSKVQPDTLFHFVSKPEYLIEMLAEKRVTPRYCREDLKYLKLKTVKEIAFPMSCFCDIGLQKLGLHMDCYGYYGIAFPKKWCIDHHFQPIQCVNYNAHLAADLKSAFNSALATIDEPSDKTNRILSDYLLHQLMYWKPYRGLQKHSKDGKNHFKCFTDECEWRYIPRITSPDIEVIISDPYRIEAFIPEYNNLLKKYPQASR